MNASSTNDGRDRGRDMVETVVETWSRPWSRHRTVRWSRHRTVRWERRSITFETMVETPDNQVRTSINRVVEHMFRPGAILEHTCSVQARSSSINVPSRRNPRASSDRTYFPSIRNPFAVSRALHLETMIDHLRALR